MAKLGEKMWISEIRPAVTDPAILSSSIFRPIILCSLLPNLLWAMLFYDMAVLVLALITDATNLNKIQMHRPMNTMFLDLPVSLLLLCVRPKMHTKLAKLTNFKTLCTNLTFGTYDCRPLHESLSYADESF